MMENLQAVPFIGIVEAIDDPNQLGRVRVRVINHHDDDIPTEDLDWATVAHPTTSTGLKGAGMSPTWLAVGSTVVGFYFDGENRNVPIVTGVLGNIPNNDTSLHSVNRLARGETPEAPKPVGPEPSEQGKSKYPFNKVIATPGGHEIELDDTEGNQRIRIKHSSGAYIQINNDGRIVIKSEDERFDITKKDYTAYSEGDVKHQSQKDFEIEVGGELTVKSEGKCKIESSGLVEIKGSKVKIN